MDHEGRLSAKSNRLDSPHVPTDNEAHCGSHKLAANQEVLLAKGQGRRLPRFRPCPDVEATATSQDPDQP